ncbi:MAG: orotate phosphoribosyltransferase [Planctomycetota bacterium]
MDALKQLLADEALEFGDFTLASGAKSTYYLDCRRITLHPMGANLIGEAMLEKIESRSPAIAAVGGMAIGADPITAAIITIAGQRPESSIAAKLRGFMVRKEPKGHGKGRQVEGPVQAGQRVVIVEDVITSGGSALKACVAAREYGLEVAGVIGIIDRLAGGAEAFAEEGVKMETLFSVRDFGIDA